MGNTQPAPVAVSSESSMTEDDEYGVAVLENFKNLDVTPEPLYDVGHGTIRYRGPDAKKSKNSVGFGFIYHPKLHDVKFKDVDYKYSFVKQTSINVNDKRLYYVVPPTMSVENRVHNVKYKPKGRGTTSVIKTVYEIQAVSVDEDADGISVDQSDTSLRAPSDDDDGVWRDQAGNYYVPVDASWTVATLLGILSEKTLRPMRDIEVWCDGDKLYGDAILSAIVGECVTVQCAPRSLASQQL